MRPTLRLSLTLGAAAAALAAAAWSWPSPDACWRLTPVSLESWRYHLRERAIEAGTPDPRTDLPDAALAAELLPQAPVDRDALAWRALLKTAREAASQPVEGIEAAATFFFRADEPPFAADGALLPAEGGPAFIRDPAEPAWLFEVARVPPGETEGRLHAWQFRTSRWELPSSLAHPYRRASLGLGVLAVAALLLAPLVLALSGLGDADLGAPEVRLVNTRKRLVVGAFVTAAAGFLLLFLPPLFGLPGMDGGFALQSVALLVTLTGVATGFFFWKSASRMGRLLSGRDLVARWRYSGLEWQSFVAGEGPRMLEENRALFRLVLAISVLVGLGFVAVAQDEASLVVFGGLMAFMVVLKAISVWVPRSRARALARDPGLVLIGRAGLCRAGEFHDWGVPGSALEDAWLEESGEGPLLGLRYRFVTRYGFDTATVRVPVPGGDRAEGERVARALGPGKS